MRKYLLFLLLGTLTIAGYSQDTQETYPVSNYKPLKVDISEDVYIRFIVWHQQWLQTNNLKEEDAKTQLTSFSRRSRFLAYAQISPRFLILTHIGLNNQTPGNLTSLGNNGNSSQFFLHDAWTEFKVSNNNAFYIGTGLHYWKGLTRLANASTLNFMTLDQARPFAQWHSWYNRSVRSAYGCLCQRTNWSVRLSYRRKQPAKSCECIGSWFKFW
ncbi:MAG: hypothetical protein AAFY41_01005 [Bacteroidota bacterium]